MYCYESVYNISLFVAIYSPNRPDVLQGRARTHARHSSGSFDDICGIKRKDIEDTTQAASVIADADPTTISLFNTTTNTAILEANTEDTAPTTTTTLDTNDTNATKEEGMGEKFGEGEGEGGWQGVMGRHTACKVVLQVNLPFLFDTYDPKHMCFTD